MVWARGANLHGGAPFPGVPETDAEIAAMSTFHDTVERDRKEEAALWAEFPAAVEANEDATEAILDLTRALRDIMRAYRRACAANDITRRRRLRVETRQMRERIEYQRSRAARLQEIDERLDVLWHPSGALARALAMKHRPDIGA